MRKFLVFCAAIFILFITVNESLLFKLDTDIRAIFLGKEKAIYNFKTDGKDILIEDKEENSKWNEFKISGINVDAAKPGAYPTNNAVSKYDYLRWFKYIADLNVNCIRVSDLMSESFYEALQIFNEENEKPLYLLQGIYFDEVDLRNGDDFYDKEVRKKFEHRIKLVISAVHGRPYKIIPDDSTQIYKWDISDYVIGYTLGVDWAPHDIIYTDTMNETNFYNGKYFKTTENGTVFEAYLASLADFAVDYEVDQFREQKLISFIGSAYNLIRSKDNEGDAIIKPIDQVSIDGIVNDIGREQDPNIISNDQGATPQVKNYLDVENIKGTDKLKTGLFVSYNIYPETNSLLDYSGDIGAYVKRINDYHTVPVVVSEYGVPSSRLAAGFINGSEKGYLTEKEQGYAFIELHKELSKVDLGGSFIFEWQDSWYKSSWNTTDDKILDRATYWSDTETYSQWFGLMAFDPGKDESICYPDETINEWENGAVLSKEDNLSLSVKSDERYMYFMVKSEDGSSLKDKKIYIDLDVTPKSGSNKAAQYGLEFEEDVDFIININGEGASDIKVQKYYSAYDFKEDIPRLRLRPNTVSLEKNMDEFVPIKAYTKQRIYIESRDEFLEKEAYETGKLTYGIGNPKGGKAYNSAADYYIGKDYIEVRIPWALMNFMDPSTKKVKGDFYENFNVLPISIDDVGIGLTVKDKSGNIQKRLKSKRYNWSDWNLPEYHERLKESYYIYKDYINSIENRGGM